MKQLFSHLGVQERFLVITGGALLVLILLYVIALEPLGERVEQLEVTVAQQTADYLWMQEAAREVRQLRGSQVAQRSNNQSLLSLTDSTARESGLGSAIRRVEPEGTDKVRIHLEQVAFDDMISWLERLVGSLGVQVENITIDSQQRGIVNARLTLRSASG